MSMSVDLWISDRSMDGVRKRGEFFCDTMLPVDSWCLGLITHLQVHTKKFEYPLNRSSSYVLGKCSVGYLNDSCYLVEADCFRLFPFYEMSWHPDRLAWGKAISAFLRELPRDWPVIAIYA